jgi:GAF domain-containing protein
VFAPLRAGGQWLGYINALYPQPRAFSEAELHRLTALAGQAAVAINNRQLFETIQERARRERLLREIATQVRTSMDADTILRTAVRELGTALNRETVVRLGGAANAGRSGDLPGLDSSNGGNGAEGSGKAAAGTGDGSGTEGDGSGTKGDGNGTKGDGAIVPALRDA